LAWVTSPFVSLARSRKKGRAVLSTERSSAAQKERTR